MTARIIGIGAYAPEQVVNLGVGDRGGEARDRGRGHFSGGD